jgi:hypothetical protein
MLNQNGEEQQVDGMMDHAFGYNVRINKHVLCSAPSHMTNMVL